MKETGLTGLHLVSSTRSPLASPRTPIHRLASALQDLLHFPDPGPLYVVCGALAANTMRGYPVWLILIGPPESGKTELLKPLIGLEGVRECGDLSGKAALLSGTRAKDTAQDATGGLLKSMLQGDDGVHRGCLIMLDFARTVLAADPASARATLGAIGMLHDQHYQRELGTDGGKTISFHGRIGFLAACTDVIDHPHHAQANAEMGERCLYYRYPKSDGWHEIQSALDNPDGTSKSQQIKELFTTWKTEMHLSWFDSTPPRPLTPSEKSFLMSITMFCARGRGGVLRDRFNRNEIAGLSRHALGPRIANSLAQLWRGCERVGCTTEEIKQVIAKTAMDSIPATRAETLQLIRSGLHDVKAIQERIGISQAATKRTLEDLQLHGLLINEGTRWDLTPDCLDLLKILDRD
jgi:hypothetical protein